MGCVGAWRSFKQQRSFISGVKNSGECSGQSDVIARM